MRANVLLHKHPSLLHNCHPLSQALSLLENRLNIDSQLPKSVARESRKAPHNQLRFPLPQVGAASCPKNVFVADFSYRMPLFASFFISLRVKRAVYQRKIREYYLGVRVLKNKRKFVAAFSLMAQGTKKKLTKRMCFL
ncbi:MAG: hypothetical protein IJY22_05730 [Clostridia bacterium]|nr:hypothetical protein [Clostridia bacterium]